MSAETDAIIDLIAEQRAQNNRYFMDMWKLVFEVAPERAQIIQRKIREGDMKISELNARLAGL